jgi:uncharacterized protein YkwD
MTHAMSRTSNVRRARPALLLVLLATVGLALSSCSSADETANFTDLNQVRASIGLPDLVRVPELDAKAVAQAQRMADRGSIFHSEQLDSGVSAGWVAIGENVALAGSVQDAQIALEASPPHYANMTNPAYSEVGVGVVTQNGIVYVAQVFVGR